MKYTECEIWLCVNENGEYVASECTDQLNERYADQIGDGEHTVARRVVKLVVKVPTPEPITLTGTVPAEPTEGSLQVA